MSKVIDAHIHIWANGTPRGAHRQLPYRSRLRRNLQL